MAIHIVNHTAGIGSVSFTPMNPQSAAALIAAYLHTYEGDDIQISDTIQGWTISGDSQITMMPLIYPLIGHKAEVTTRYRVQVAKMPA